MSAINGRVGRELGNDSGEALHQLLPAATIEVGAPYALMEKCVASKDNLLFLAIVADTARRVAWGGKNGELVGAKRNPRTVGLWSREKRVGRNLARIVNTHHVVHLMADVHEPLVGGSYLRLQAEFAPDGVVAKAMVEVAVGAEQMTGCEVVSTDIADYGFTFILEISAAVNDDGFAGLVAHNEAVLLQHVADKGLDGKHGGN